MVRKKSQICLVVGWTLVKNSQNTEWLATAVAYDRSTVTNSKIFSKNRPSDEGLRRLTSVSFGNIIFFCHFLGLLSLNLSGRYHGLHNFLIFFNSFKIKFTKKARKFLLDIKKCLKEPHKQAIRNCYFRGKKTQGHSPLQKLEVGRHREQYLLVQFHNFLN